MTTLTLASSVTRASGDPVRLYAGSDGVQLLYSTDGDVGAFPFGSPVTPTGGGKNRLRLRIRMGDLALLGAILPLGWRVRRRY